jgi:uncharacterized protein (TIRG00374 family)
MPPLAILKRLALYLFFALVLFATLFALLADLDKVKLLLFSIAPHWFPAIIGAVLFNYALRFLKWQYYLRLLHIDISRGDSLWIFFSSFTMVLSPGKLGEVIKSVFLKARYGLPMSRTAPIVMAERLTDLFGLLVLSAIGCSRFAYGGKVLAVIGAGLGVGLICITRPGFWQWWEQHILNRFAALHRLRGSFKILEESTGNLLALPAMVCTVPLSALSWAGEGVALFFIFRALGVEKPDLLGIALFAHAFSSIIGAFSFLPGGLLVTEGALSVFFLYVGIGREQAVSATFLIRALTLWFAVILGTIIFLLGRRPGDLEPMNTRESPVPESV